MHGQEEGHICSQRAAARATSPSAASILDGEILRQPLIALPICVLTAAVVVAGCTSDPGSKPTAAPSPTADQSPASPVDAAVDAAKAQLERLQPGTDEPSPRRGSGPLGEIFGNTLMGKPAKAGTIDFVFTCSGESIVTIEVRDGQTPIPGAAGELKCGGRDGFKRTVPVTTKSALSFPASATTLKDGGFAYAWVGDIR